MKIFTARVQCEKLTIYQNDFAISATQKSNNKFSNFATAIQKHGLCCSKSTVRHQWKFLELLSFTLFRNKMNNSLNQVNWNHSETLKNVGIFQADAFCNSHFILWRHLLTEQQ